MWPWAPSEGDDDNGDGTPGSSSGSDELTYWEEKYGVTGSSSGGPPPSIDVSAFISNYNDTDKALALFRLILASTFIVLGVYSLVQFYRSRWILDIRTRSARLVMLGGIAVTVSFLVAINDSLRIIWGSEYSLRWFWSSILLFFITPNLFGSYFCRALRLAVVFHPRAKRALPWLIPERNYMWVLFVFGLGMIAIPIRQEYTLEIWEVIPEQTDILSHMSLAFAGALMCLYPFIRKVDDLFNISKELIVVTVLLVILSVGQKLVYQYGGRMEIRWIGNHLTFIISATVFGVSVVDPLRRLAFDPLAASKRNYADRVLLSRREGHSTARTVSSGHSSRLPDSEDEGRTARVEEGRAARPAGTVDVAGASGFEFYATTPWGNNANAANSAANHSNQQRRRAGAVVDGVEVWDFERLARTPLLAAAFEDYSRKALCHESVLFLSEVSRYQNDDHSAPSGGPGPTQYEAFCRISDTFIKAGAREEVNISDTDKKRIVMWSQKGQAWFDFEDEEERRLVFGQAYVEVRNMLEANLLRRFLQTDQFKNVRAQREHVTAMMDSPDKS